MNGLKLIRKQCNFKQEAVGKIVGVSAKTVEDWENGVVEIPSEKKKQLVEFFGIEEYFFDEISQKEKNLILDKPLFEYTGGEMNITYRFMPMNKDVPQMASFIKERKYTIEEEMEYYRRKNEELQERIERNAKGPQNGNYRDEIISGRRLRDLLSHVITAHESCFAKERLMRMRYWNVLALISEVLEEEFTVDGGGIEFASTLTDPDDAKIAYEISNSIRKRIAIEREEIEEFERQLKERKTKRNSETKETKSVLEKIIEAQNAYYNVKKEHPDVGEFSMMI